MIRFDSKAAYKDLSDAFAEEMGRLVGLVLAQAQANVTDAEVRESLKAFLDMTLPGFFEGVVLSDSWKAWLEEWGKGSMMDRNNPDLFDYIMSDMWNPARKNDLAIRGRPRGPYRGIDGQTHFSSGAAEGRNLEAMALHGKIKRNPERFLPKPPTHFLRDALLANEKKILDVMQSVLDKWIEERFGLFILTEEG